MSAPIISVEGLGKRYRIRHQQEGQRYVALRDVLASKLSPRRWLAKNGNGRHPPADEDFWALKDVSFDIQQGEVVGIIGRNGAGKSTLLKILSRITEPTEGRVTLRGRVASLLEVGTGFHPELTGRENIFLNGAILGMSRADIVRRFDAIVAFAEVERFLDTPVKRYSSGMYVRLAFAVAAHLEPEVLIVDEVLAVGDAEFQEKCLGKMEDDARAEGRTVLFVSHNMRAVLSLCTRAVLLDRGRPVSQGEPRRVIGEYLARACSSTGEIAWSESAAPGNEEFRLIAVRLYSKNERRTGTLSSSHDLIVEFDFLANTGNPGLCIGFDLTTPDGAVVFRTYQTDSALHLWPRVERGRNRWRCTVPKNLLNCGTYLVTPRVGIHNVYWIVDIGPVLQFDISLNHGTSPLWNDLTASNRPGSIAPILTWDAVGAAASTARFGT